MKRIWMLGLTAVFAVMAYAEETKSASSQPVREDSETPPILAKIGSGQQVEMLTQEEMSKVRGEGWGEIRSWLQGAATSPKQKGKFNDRFNDGGQMVSVAIEYGKNKDGTLRFYVAMKKGNATSSTYYDIAAKNATGILPALQRGAAKLRK